jgi:hypothetical protein
MANKGFRDDQRTLQSNIKTHNTDMSGYSLFLGGLNVKRAALEQYNVLKTGKGRIFLTKMPYFMKELMPNATKNFKHVIEYGFIDITGIQDLVMDFDTITGGYAGRSFEIPTILKDETNEITIKILEFAGSPMREYIEMWLTGVADPNSGFTHYHGLALPSYDEGGNWQEAKVEVSQANHTMEAFYVVTDQTGINIEFACMLCNMFPRSSRRSHFDMTAGTSEHVELELAFTCTMYTSPDINAVAKLLLDKYRVLYNYLDFDPQTGVNIDATGNKTYGLDKDEFPDSNIKDWTFR